MVIFPFADRVTVLQRQRPGFVRACNSVWCTAWLLASCLTAVFCSPAPAEVSEVGIAAGHQALWLHYHRSDDDGRKLIHFAYRLAGAPPRDRVIPLFIEPVTGHVRLAAVRGNDLHVFFRDGTHRRFVPNPVLSDSTNPPRRFSEVALPNSSLPAAIAVDSVTGELYALVSSRQATALLPNESEPTQSGSVDKSASGVGSESEWQDLSDCERVLVRYGGYGWIVDRLAPKDLTLSSRIVGLWVSRNVAHLVYQPSDDSGRTVHRVSSGAEESWSESATIPLDESWQVCAHGWAESAPILIGKSPSNGSVIISTLQYGDDGWREGCTLVDDSAEVVVFPQDAAVGVFASTIVVARTMPAGKIEVGRWSLTDGKPTEPFAEVKQLSVGYDPGAVSPVVHTIQYGILFFVLLIVFIWRRDSVLEPIALGKGMQVASFRLRVTAYAIDLLIVVPVWIAAVSVVWPVAEDGMNMTQELAFLPGVSPTWRYLAWGTLGLTAAIHGFVFETLWASTPGKRLLGLRVVCAGGTRCSMGAYFWRNIFRIIDFLFAPAALLVIMTPSRQRLGDLVARTVVVQLRPDSARESVDSEIDVDGDNPPT